MIKNIAPNKSYIIERRLVKNSICGVGITNENKENILEYVVNSIKNTSENFYIVTPNPEMIVLASRNVKFKAALNNAKIALLDGVGILWAGKLLKAPFKDRFTGVDFIESICREVIDYPITVGFLGGRDGVAEKTAECLQKKYPGLKVVFKGEKLSDQEVSINSSNGMLKLSNLEVKKTQISKSKANIDILFVAYGAPKQELWMEEHINRMPVRIMVGVGGAFDYISGKVPRAPLFVQNLGLEWLFRLILQPWRIKRQLALIYFVILIFRNMLADRI